MARDILVWILAAVLPVLIVLNDKQAVHLLEGKLFRRGQDTSAAKEVYSRHKEPISRVLFVVGIWIAVVGLVILGTDAAGIAVAVLGGVFALIGVVGRMKSFRAADKELS